MEYAVVLIVLAGFGYFVYTKIKASNERKTRPGAPGNIEHPGNEEQK